MSYSCLNCGALQGEPAENGSENWYWRIIPNGRVGPFHSVSCSKEFRLNAEESTFTLKQFTEFAFLQHRYEEGL